MLAKCWHKKQQKQLKTVRINFSRTPETNQKLVAIQGVLIQEKQLNLGKNIELCGI